jgi:hypothetical protein
MEGNTMAWKKQEAFAEFEKFEEVGTEVEGKVIAIKEGQTEHGKADFVILETEEGARTSFCISSSLAYYEWENRIGQMVKVVYTGDAESKKRKGKTFKTFEVFVDEELSDNTPI